MAISSDGAVGFKSRAISFRSVPQSLLLELQEDRFHLKGLHRFDLCSM